MEINKAERSLKIKIAYYGPATCGKTTNLNVLYQEALGPRKGDFISVNSQQDRTILCDLLPLRAGGFCGYDVRLRLLAVPGQSMYLVSRRAVLKGSDGVVFVANSATDRWHDNIQSFAEMGTHLRAQQIDPATVPLVIQYNKRDLPQVLELDALDRGLNQRGVPAFARGGPHRRRRARDPVRHPRADPRGPRPPPPRPRAPGPTDGVGLDRAVAAQHLRPRQLERHRGRGGSPASSRPLKLRIAMPEEAGRAGGGRGGHALGRVPRGVLRRGLGGAEPRPQRHAPGARPDPGPPDRDPDRPRAGGRRTPHPWTWSSARCASWASWPGRPTRPTPPSSSPSADVAEVLNLPPLVSDPLTRLPTGAAFLAGQIGLRMAQLHLAGEDVDLTEALARAEPPFQAVALVPLRSAERPLGLALLYYWPHASLPTAGPALAPEPARASPRGTPGGHGRARGGHRRRAAAHTVAGLGFGHGLRPHPVCPWGRSAVSPWRSTTSWPPCARPGVRAGGGAGDARHPGGRRAAALRPHHPHPPLRGGRSRSRRDAGDPRAGGRPRLRRPDPRHEWCPGGEPRGTRARDPATTTMPR